MIINLRSTSQVNHEERGQHSRSPKESCGCGGSGFLNTKSTKDTKKILYKNKNLELAALKSCKKNDRH